MDVFGMALGQANFGVTVWSSQTVFAASGTMPFPAHLGTCVCLKTQADGRKNYQNRVNRDISFPSSLFSRSNWYKTCSQTAHCNKWFRLVRFMSSKICMAMSRLHLLSHAASQAELEVVIEPANPWAFEAHKVLVIFEWGRNSSRYSNELRNVALCLRVPGD